MLAAGVVALALLGSGIVLLGTSKTESPVGAASAATVADAPQSIQAAAASLVLLHISEGTTSRVANGVVLEGGALIATTAPMSAAATVVIVTNTLERFNARVLGVDLRSGLRVLQPDTTLPAPPVASVPASSKTAVAVSLGDATGARIRWENATVLSADVPVVVNHITLGALRVPDHLDQIPGSILVSPEGALEAVAVPQLGKHLYLPASLITTLAHHLAKGTNNAHFVLRISAQTLPGKGVRVVGVDPKGPAAGVLFAGDVVVAWESTPLTCTSELVDALYTQDTTQALHLTVARSGTQLQVVVAPVPTS